MLSAIFFSVFSNHLGLGGNGGGRFSRGADDVACSSRHPRNLQIIYVIWYIKYSTNTF